MYDDSFRKRYGVAPVAISQTIDCTQTPPHIHNEIEILYILKGSSKVKISDQSYDASQGDLFFVNPLEVHSVTIDTNEPYEHKCVCFDSSLIVDKQLSQELLGGHKGMPNYFQGDATAALKLTALFEHLYASVENNKGSLLFESAAYISLIFSELIDNGLLTDHFAANKSAIFSREVLAFIAGHYAEDITSKMIAEKLFYTQSYFCRAFKKNFGVVFSEYLTMYRILIARDNLRSTSKKVTEIAAECGFNDAVYFTKCFKKCLGMTPLKYRKSQHSTKM